MITWGRFSILALFASNGNPPLRVFFPPPPDQKRSAHYDALINFQVQLPPTTTVNDAPTVPNSCLIKGARFGSEISCFVLASSNGKRILMVATLSKTARQDISLPNRVPLIKQLLGTVGGNI